MRPPSETNEKSGPDHVDGIWLYVITIWSSLMCSNDGVSEGSGKSIPSPFVPLGSVELTVPILSKGPGIGLDNAFHGCLK